eukprot:8722406-Heterocapsa_arctica.AAC.1
MAAKAVARADQRVLLAAGPQPSLPRGSPAPPSSRSGSCPQRLLYGRAGRCDRRRVRQASRRASTDR